MGRLVEAGLDEQWHDAAGDELSLSWFCSLRLMRKKASSVSGCGSMAGGERGKFKLQT